MAQGVGGDWFQIEHIEEPRPTDETVRNWPRVQDAQMVVYFLLYIRISAPAAVAKRDFWHLTLESSSGCILKQVKRQLHHRIAGSE
jgi:hypothetical protein